MENEKQELCSLFVNSLLELNILSIHKDKTKNVKGGVNLMGESREIFYSKFILSFNIKRIQYRLDLLYITFENLSLDKLQQDIVVHSFLEICRSVINIGTELAISKILCDCEAIISLVDIGVMSEQDAEIFLEMLSFRDLYYADSIEFTNTKLEQFCLNSSDEFDRFVFKIQELA